MTDSHIRRRLERLVRRADDLDEELERARKEVRSMRIVMEDVTYNLEQRERAARGVPAAKVPVLARAPEDVSAWEIEARAGATRLEVRLQPDGMALVSVNGRAPFLLPPKPRVLLDILSEPGSAADDGLVGWRSRGEVADALRKRLGRPLGRDDVTRTVYRLREVFRAAHENEHLVQTNREHQTLRFALRADAVRIWQM